MRPSIVLVGIAALAAGATAQEPDAKIDEGLATASGHVAIFVRMADQLLGGAGDYDAFCAKHAQAPRSTVRAATVARLRAAAERDREALRNTVAALEKSRDLRDLRHFWIVNGFACDATAKACAALAARPEVAFVYRQRSRCWVPPPGWRWR